MKTADLIGPALDWAVAKCEYNDGRTIFIDFRLVLVHTHPQSGVHFRFSPSTDWSQGGPIIDRGCIATYASGACSVEPKNPDYWVAEILGTDEMVTQYGPTPLIAAMRCHVASKLGDEVEIPEDLK